ncbi:methyltransferase [Actinomadura graeca]|uniref:Methyltransferase n=1 Tax=Actinomadura graeca TaxID=2750812 RepID=A0ABX8R4E7_9ACTN|nr:hypothetical protein [Actinomadura graeca]QXJ25960.1 methyltransferase [Actinomadura graeca]
MAALTRRQATRHLQACELVALERDLTDEEKWFVLERWQESATAASPVDGAFFTPLGLARDLSLHVHGERIIDLGAGIGRLCWQCRDVTPNSNGDSARQLVCIERNPAYAAVGRKILPQARWIVADIFEVPALGLGRFDCAIANPPFGRLPRSGRRGPRYRGSRLELHVIDIAADLARQGVFLVPQDSAPFSYSGKQRYLDEPGPHYRRFTTETGIRLEPSIGIDTSGYDRQWHSTPPPTEVVIADFTERAGPGHLSRPGSPAHHRPSRVQRAPTGRA